jgi:hypothetical protein
MLHVLLLQILILKCCTNKNKEILLCFLLIHPGKMNGSISRYTWDEIYWCELFNWPTSQSISIVYINIYCIQIWNLMEIFTWNIAHPVLWIVTFKLLSEIKIRLFTWNHFHCLKYLMQGFCVLNSSFMRKLNNFLSWAIKIVRICNV